MKTSKSGFYLITYKMSFLNSENGETVNLVSF